MNERSKKRESNPLGDHWVFWWAVSPALTVVSVYADVWFVVQYGRTHHLAYLAAFVLIVLAGVAALYVQIRRVVRAVRSPQKLSAIGTEQKDVSAYVGQLMGQMENPVLDGSHEREEANENAVAAS